MSPCRLLLLALCCVVSVPAAFAADVDLGPRPYYLIDRMKDGALKSKLALPMGSHVRGNSSSGVCVSGIAQEGAGLDDECFRIADFRVEHAH